MQSGIAIITESAEHHFLTTLENIKANPQGWMALHFAFSKKTSHSDLIKSLKTIRGKTGEARKKSENFLQQLAQKLPSSRQGFVYLFCDNDIVVLISTEKGEERALINSIYKDIAKTLKPGLSEAGSILHEIYNYQKLADQKILSAQRFKAYHLMGDINKTSSLVVRRKRRENPQVMIVEDDRFTASYTANIIGREYEVVLCRNGEDAIIGYIENAPDIVFLDIHLPGLSGYETLKAINAIDRGAFVVMLSVDTVKDSIVAAARGGARNFLKKPFNHERLLNIVKTAPHVRACNHPKGESLH